MVCNILVVDFSSQINYTTKKTAVTYFFGDPQPFSLWRFFTAPTFDLYVGVAALIISIHAPCRGRLSPLSLLLSFP